MATVDLQSTNESGMLYYDHEQIKGQLDGLDTSNSINDKLNGITNEVNRKGIIYSKTFTDATEYSTGNDTYTTTHTFTLTTPINTIIQDMSFIASLKITDSARNVRAIITLTGTNLGTIDLGYLLLIPRRDTDFNSPVISIDGTSRLLSVTGVTSYSTQRISGLLPKIILLDPTTTVEIKISGYSGQTAYIKDVYLNMLLISDYLTP